MQAGSALGTYSDFAEWQPRWAPEQSERESERQRIGQKYQADVLEMGQTPLLCCPEDHKCKGSCKTDKTLCRMCEFPICLESHMCLQKKQLSPMGLMNDNFIGFLDPWIYQADITWMEQLRRLPFGPAWPFLH